MGNSSSSGRGHHDDSVDYGSLVPQGVYTGPRDWNQPIVSQLIVARKLAPFYRPLEDYDESWDDEQILAARKELPDPDNADTVTRIEATANSHRSKRPVPAKEPSRAEALIYKGAVECPICFLYYPPNINHSRCCDQAICTECFVQIKRSEPTTTHIVSEPAACPYCVQENFGVVYNPPPWRAGLGSEGSNGLWSESTRPSEPSAPPTHKRRQKSFSADSPEVVTTDQIRPDWEAKLDAVRAAVARRANRRIIMRQVGDRLIPVGVTSGRVHALTPEEAAAAGADATGSRRSRRRQAPGGFEQFVGMAGQDLEELMLMEAMRLSLLDHEEHQRKEAEEKKKQEAAIAATAAASGEGSSSTEGATSSPAPDPSLPGLSRETHSSGASSFNLIPSSSANPSSQGAQTQESLTPGRKSWSTSRSRTPPPPPANPAGNVASEEGQAAWRDRTVTPPAFSMLSAALTSTSTAAAFLGSASASRSVTPEPSTATGSANATGTNLSGPSRDAREQSSAGSTSTGSFFSSSSSYLAGNPTVIPAERSELSSVTSLESGESGAGIGLASYNPLQSASASQESSLEHTHLIQPETSQKDLSMAGESPGDAAVTYLEEVSR